MGDADDQQRFRALFDAHYQEVLRFTVRRCRHRAEAEDAAAEVFETAWRRLETIHETKARAWLYATARNVLANRRRRIGKQPHDDPTVFDVADEAQTGVVDEADRLRRAMAWLSTQDREVLSLAAWEQLDASEAAEVLGCTPVTYRVRLHRARNRLQAALDQRPRSAVARKANR